MFNVEWQHYKIFALISCAGSLILRIGCCNYRPVEVASNCGISWKGVLGKRTISNQDNNNKLLTVVLETLAN